ncbi:5837_t:CDS:10 [Funneliformis caledonium]|uniref:5837_t:CDS:1 n=1 Tax=Funneliformis caledonium TaxID=1117310 RepID=A0A9N9BH98_9GLOM|nr:5837_t:CDS:10 [Funneliformis caledonium]
MSNVRVYFKPLYTPQSLQLELQLRTLKNLLESISEDKPNNLQKHLKTFALTLEENSETLGKCFELIIQSIRYQPLAQEPLETLLADLKSAWNKTSRRISQKSSNVSKMNGDTFNINISISDRRTSENQADPHREWTVTLNNIFSDHVFKQKYEEITLKGDKQKRRNTYWNTTDDREEDTDNREKQRRPEGENDIITQFLQGFEDLLKAYIWKHQLQNFKQRNKETIDEYVAQITELGKRLDLQGIRKKVDKIAEFIKGLRSEFIGMSGGFVPAQITLFMSKLKEQNKPNNNSNNNNRSNNRDTRTCHKCNKVGHIAKDCKSEQRNNNSFNNNKNNSNNNNNNNTKFEVKEDMIVTESSGYNVLLRNDWITMQVKAVIDTNKQIMIIKQNNETDVILITCFSKIDSKVFTPIDFVKKGSGQCLYKTLSKGENCSYCKALHQDLQEYQITVSINKAQIKASNKLVEISKGKEIPIENLTKDQQQQLQQLLEENKDLFANEKLELTQTNISQHAIITENATLSRFKIQEENSKMATLYDLISLDILEVNPQDVLVIQPPYNDDDHLESKLKLTY